MYAMLLLENLTNTWVDKHGDYLESRQAGRCADEDCRKSVSKLTGRQASVGRQVVRLVAECWYTGLQTGLKVWEGKQTDWQAGVDRQVNRLVDRLIDGVGWRVLVGR